MLFILAIVGTFVIVKMHTAGPSGAAACPVVIPARLLRAKFRVVRLFVMVVVVSVFDFSPYFWHL